MARGSSGIKMPTEFEEALNQSFFKRLFVSERKQIAMIADEKSPARISHRIFATRSLRNVGKVRKSINQRFSHDTLCRRRRKVSLSQG